MIDSLNSNTNRISGLASGLETEELVKALTGTTRSKIEKAEQDKQILEWKREDYRNVLSDLVEFNSAHFGSDNNSISIGDSLRALTAKSSNTDYVNVVAGDGATELFKVSTYYHLIMLLVSLFYRAKALFFFHI